MFEQQITDKRAYRQHNADNDVSAIGCYTEPNRLLAKSKWTIEHTTFLRFLIHVSSYTHDTLRAERTTKKKKKNTVPEAKTLHKSLFLVLALALHTDR